jgi:hypothetical protein
MLNKKRKGKNTCDVVVVDEHVKKLPRTRGFTLVQTALWSFHWMPASANKRIGTEYGNVICSVFLWAD